MVRVIEKMTPRTTLRPQELWLGSALTTGNDHLDRVLPPERFRPLDFRGTLAPFFRASERAIAIACLRLFTVLPLLPDLRVPFLRRRIALSTRFDAALPYFLLPEDFFAAIRKTSKHVGFVFVSGPVAHLVPERSALKRFSSALNHLT